MEAGIERLTALVFIILGLSHVAAPRVWVRFFIDMRAKGDVAGLLNAFVHLPVGLLILAFHPVWSGSGLLVTLIGCGLTLKGTLYFLWPSLASWSMARVGEDKAWHFQVAGAAAVAVGVFIGWTGLNPAA